MNSPEEPTETVQPAPAVRTGGIILCGGRSSRMGTDKALLRFPGGNLLRRTLDTIGEVAGPLVLSLARGQEIADVPEGVLTVQDEEDYPGPLWGLAQAFRRLQGQADQVLVLPVDLPFFTADWMRRLIDGMPGNRACLFRWEGITNALTAVYRLDLLEKVERLMGEGVRRPLALSIGEQVRIIDLESLWSSEQGAPPLMDVDTPEDYRAALLRDGVGDANGVAITITAQPPPGSGGGPAVTVPLYAVRGEQGIPWMMRLYPEWEEAAAAAGLTAMVEPAAGGGSAYSPSPLKGGEHLRLRWR